MEIELKESKPLSTPNSPNIVGHFEFIELTLILVMEINVGHINFQHILEF